MVEPSPFKPNIDFSSNKAGSPYATLDNFRKMLKAHLIKLQYNEITKEIDVTIPGKEFLPDNRLNCAIGWITSLCNEYKMSSNFVLKYMLMLADENKINPVAEWIESKPWDGISRIEKFYSTIKSANESLKEILLNRWMISAIAALYEPNGISASGMLVLNGCTNLGKTNWFKNLLPLDRRSWLKDGMLLDATKRDSIMPCLENWLVELGELEATFKKSDLAALKAFITADRDIMRLSYAAANSRFPRRTVLFGSVDKRSFLRDPAGNRRFWTVECLKIDHTHGLDMQQIWAEFKVLYDTGETWHLTPDEFNQLMTSNEEYEMIDPMEEKLRRKYNWGDDIIEWKTATEILEQMSYLTISIGDATKCALLVRKLNGGHGRRTGGRNFLGLPRMAF